MNRVFVTGIGVVSPIGIGVDNFIEGLKQGKSGISRITSFDPSSHTVQIAAEIKDFDPEQYMGKKEIRRHDRYSQFAMAATHMAAEQAGLKEKNFDPMRAGVLFSTGIGGIHTLESESLNYRENGPHRVSPFLVPMMICDIAAGYIAMEYGLKGPNFSIVSACASGMHGIGESFLKIAYGECDIVVTGASESAITPLTVAGFAKMKALSTRNDAPEKASRPFDKDRDGFIMGEGAGALVLESEESARRRGSTILAEVKGYGATADAYHLTAPHPEGEGAYNAMLKAISINNFPIDRINYINAHGTSTPLGDVSEINAIRRLFGDKTVNLTINGTKSMIGHLLGAAGAVGSVATIIQIQNGFIHPTINLESPDDVFQGLDLAARVAKNKQIDGGLVNSFGFGGHNASILFCKPQ